MWTVIYIAQSKEGATKLQDMLSEQGVLVKTRQIGKAKYSDGIYEILVPETEVEDACTILEQLNRDF